MARTLSEIYDSIIAEKNTMSTLTALQPTMDDEQTLLQDLTSTSKVAIWRLWAYLMAVAIWVHENIIDQLLEKREAGTVAWHHEQSLKFQYGDPLVLQSGKYVYSPIISANQIIKLASVNEDLINPKVVIKVAKLSSGLPVPLSLSEKTAFEAYWKTIKFAGTKIIIISTNGDIFKFGADIFFDPLLMANNGSLLISPTTFPVHDAVKKFIRSLPFDGRFELAELVDQIQVATGVVNVVPTVCQAKVGVNPYIDILSQAGHVYKPFAGYMTLSTASGETLNDLLNFIPNV